MQLINNSGMVTGYTMGMDASGRECLVVAVKGTFNIPKVSGQKPALMDEQLPLVESDTFFGEPGFSAPEFESEYAPVKHRCDITLVGSAYAPEGKETGKVQVGFKVGSKSKVLNVLGDRYWEATTGGYRISAPVPFEKRAFSYDIAFGGVDQFHEDEKKHDPYMLNPVGIGYHKVTDENCVQNTPAPSTEECDKAVVLPNGNYKPMALGPIGRGWLPRYKLGGTYDETWLDDTFPFLPADFNERYYQSAPDDQQIDFLQGGEQVMLLNVTEDGKRAFEIPKMDMPVVFFKKKSQREEKTAMLDTLILDPDNERFSCVWRANVQLRNNAFEVPEALVGKASRAWWRARELGKTYYPGLNAFIAGQNNDEADD